MPTHELKTWPELYDVVVTGRKSFEARRDDRGFAEGDVLHLREYDPGRGGYTGRHTERFVNYVLHGPAFGIEEGHVVMAVSSTLFAATQEVQPQALEPVGEEPTVTVTFDREVATALAYEGDLPGINSTKERADRGREAIAAALSLPEEESWTCDSCGAVAPIDAAGWGQSTTDDAGVTAERCPSCKRSQPEDERESTEEAGTCQCGKPKHPEASVCSDCASELSAADAD